MLFKLFLHCLTCELELEFFVLRQRHWHATGRRRAARGCAGRRVLRPRSVLRLIANMTLKLFLHCLMICELEFFFWQCGTAARGCAGRSVAAAAPPLAVGGLSGDITYDHHKFSDITIM
jgi:hypothetical protein